MKLRFFVRIAVICLAMVSFSLVAEGPFESYKASDVTSAFQNGRQILLPANLTQGDTRLRRICPGLT